MRKTRCTFLFTYGFLSDTVCSSEQASTVSYGSSISEEWIWKNVCVEKSCRGLLLGSITVFALRDCIKQLNSTVKLVVLWDGIWICEPLNLKQKWSSLSPKVWWARVINLLLQNRGIFITSAATCPHHADTVRCKQLSHTVIIPRIASEVQWSEFLATDPEVPGSIPGSIRFSEMLWFWNGVHSASWGYRRSYFN
jgi:hypothetical protein